MSIRMLGLCLLAFALSSCLADPPKPSPGPDLGPQKYTIHASGTLQEVIHSLAGLTRHDITLDMSSAPANLPPKPLPEAPVSLNFDNASLGEILLSLCTQAGVVYEVDANRWVSDSKGPLGYPITLCPGDPAVDGRPACVVGDYTIRVSDVAVTRTERAGFHWGSTSPQKSGPTGRVEVSLEILPSTGEAAARLAALDGTVRGVADVGQPIVTDRRVGGLVPLRERGAGGGDPWSPPVPRTYSVFLSLPDPGATVLTRLEGSLMLFSQVKVNEFRFPAASEGQTLTQGDVTAKVTRWKCEGGHLKWAVDMTYAPPSGAARPQSQLQFSWAKTSVLTADGIGRGYGVTGSNTEGQDRVGDDVWYGAPGAQGAAPVPVGVQITTFRCNAADKTTPFVIENIPLP